MKTVQYTEAQVRSKAAALLEDMRRRGTYPPSMDTVRRLGLPRNGSRVIIGGTTHRVDRCYMDDYGQFCVYCPDCFVQEWPLWKVKLVIED